MNIEDVIKLKESGFTIDEIKQLMNTNPSQQTTQKDETVEDNKGAQEEKVLEEKVLDKGGGEMNVFVDMMNQFKDSMNQQMEAFKQTIHLSNMNQNLGNLEQNDSSKIAEEFTANIINPKNKK